MTGLFCHPAGGEVPPGEAYAGRPGEACGLAAQAPNGTLGAG